MVLELDRLECGASLIGLTEPNCAWSRPLQLSGG